MSRSLVIWFVAALAAAADSATAQTSTWYQTVYAGAGYGYTYGVQGGTATQFWSSVHPGESPLYVDYSTGTVFEAPHYSSEGSKYTLTGGYLGDFSFIGTGGPGDYDGTWDGTNTYTLNYFSGDVLKRGPGFSGSPTAIFNPTSVVGSQQLGITYDYATGHLWTSDYGGGSVHEWGMDGSLVQSISIPGAAELTALAYDGADDTFWVNDFAAGSGRQFDRHGNMLGTSTLYAYILGGEIGVAPAPGAIALLGFGGLAAARRRRA